MEEKIFSDYFLQDWKSRAKGAGSIKDWQRQAAVNDACLLIVIKRVMVR